MTEITLREKEAIMRSLGTGLVPRVGLHHLMVGRKREIEILCRDLDLLKNDASTFRLITGSLGAGKTFLLQTYKFLAAREGFVIAHADLAVNQRLHGSDGKARNLYAELMHNLTNRNFPQGGGLRALLEEWISKIIDQCKGVDNEEGTVEREIETQLRELKKFVGGYEFALVLKQYYVGYHQSNPALQDAALRWLKAEYSTKTEARKDLGVRRIIGDEDIYNAWKIFAAFCRIAGYRGLIILLDEFGTLTDRLPNAKSRQGSFQVLLNIVNDCCQGSVEGLGFLLAGTNGSLTDSERGLFSYEPLRTRLQPIGVGYEVSDYNPIIKLTKLGLEELLVLLENIRHVQALGNEANYLLPDQALKDFVESAIAKLGKNCLANPREVVRAFVEILQGLAENPGKDWRQIFDEETQRIAHRTSDAEKQLANIDIRAQ